MNRTSILVSKWNYELVKKLMRHLMMIICRKVLRIREHFLARDFVSLCYSKGISKNNNSKSSSCIICWLLYLLESALLLLSPFSHVRYALLHYYYAHGPGAMMKNLQLKVLCCCGTISCTTAGLTIKVALVGINKLLYPVADVSALTVNTPGLESFAYLPCMCKNS